MNIITKSEIIPILSPSLPWFRSQLFIISKPRFNILLMTFLQASQPSHSTFLQESKSDGQKKEVISPTNIKNKQTDLVFRVKCYQYLSGTKNKRNRNSPYCNSLKNQPVDTLYNSQITSHNQSKHTKKCFSTERRRNHSPLRRAGLAVKKEQRSLQGSWLCILRTEQK